MLANIIILVVATCVGGTTALKEEFNDWNKCGFMYKELGCKPTFGDGYHVCPTKFTCPSLDVTYPPKTCYVSGKTYQNGEDVPGFDDCGPPCSCYDGKVECATIDCPDQEGDNTDCVTQYQGNGCCDNVICNKNKIGRLETCDIGGKLYREGEIVAQQSGECGVLCTCPRNFTGDIKDLDCKEVKCKLELYHRDELLMRAAPVFTESNSCCPVDWEWPLANYDYKMYADTNKCYFGKSSVALGSEYDMHKPCMICRCIRPPFLTCILMSNCRH